MVGGELVCVGVLNRLVAGSQDGLVWRCNSERDWLQIRWMTEQMVQWVGGCMGEIERLGRWRETETEGGEREPDKQTGRQVDWHSRDKQTDWHAGKQTTRNGKQVGRK